MNGPRSRVASGEVAVPLGNQPILGGEPTRVAVVSTVPGERGQDSRKNRRYPRSTGELGAFVGDDPRNHKPGRLPAWPTTPVAWPALRELEAEALEDLGGADQVSSLRREVLRLGLVAHGVTLALLAEMDAKAERSRKAGHTPCPSQYKATKALALFLDLAARRYREVGLSKKARQISLDKYLARCGPQTAQGDDEGQGPTPSSDRSEAASVAAGIGMPDDGTEPGPGGRP